MNPAQNRIGSASALSQDNQEVMPGGRAAAQSASSTVLPAPADPITTVSRWSAPDASRPCSSGLLISVAGSGVARAPARSANEMALPARVGLVFFFVDTAPARTFSATERFERR